ncbi:Virulence-associated protein E [Roseovarius gaetbuli]|uniref:Virulence-associated protein E n=1 Tax=Roseovarius gaetbuli TaxID=1356575 RepID=A0A1X6Z337_9RHOB|nr:VapE domain-containing protein [Roseovarius gaetbuli]SLN39097.1 Virulence-associated protein E [Roseovarius gaetbuli]
MRDDVINHQIWLAIGKTNRGKSKASRTSLRALNRMFEEPSRDNSITYAEYMKLGESKEGKAVQGEKKAAAGFLVAGKFKNGSRKIGDMVGRSGIQIDIDYATPEQAEFILSGLAEINEWAYLWHTTRAHCDEKPRIRIIVPLTRMVDGDEANAITRYLALTLADDPREAIEIPDLVSFRPNQIMYLPSVSRMQEYRHGFHGDSPILNPDEFLAAHPDWQDYTKLPRQDDENSAENTTGKTSMEDPTEKPGVIGAFCRAYGAEEAIAEFLDDIYVPGQSSGTDIRYTYALGSAYNGVVIYDDTFVQSFHGTDPADGQHNIFDLVRIHKFGHLDEDANGNTGPGNMPSFKAMTEWALKDELVKKERANALAFDDEEFDDLEDDDGVADEADLLSTDDDGEDNNSDFDDLPDEGEPESKPKKKAKDKKAEAEDDGSPWQERLVLNKIDQVEKSKFNCILIITNDRRIAPNIAYNELSGGPDAMGLLRFSKVDVPQPPIIHYGDNTWASPAFQKIMHKAKVGRKWTDIDTAALAYCLSAPTRDKGYGKDFVNQDVKHGMMLAAQRNSYNPVLRRLELTEWDGVARVETFFLDWLGCVDNAYHRELALLWFMAAIARLYEPGLLNVTEN